MPVFSQNPKPMHDNEGADNIMFDSSEESLDPPDKDNDKVFELSSLSEEKNTLGEAVNSRSLSNYRPTILKSVDDDFISSLGGSASNATSLSNIVMKHKNECEAGPSTDHDDGASGMGSTKARNILNSLIDMRPKSSQLVSIVEENDQKDTHL